MSAGSVLWFCDPQYRSTCIIYTRTHTCEYHCSYIPRWRHFQTDVIYIHTQILCEFIVKCRWRYCANIEKMKKKFMISRKCFKKLICKMWQKSKLYSCWLQIPKKEVYYWLQSKVYYHDACNDSVELFMQSKIFSHIAHNYWRKLIMQIIPWYDVTLNCMFLPL